MAASVAGLQQRNLFRTLRPTVPGLSAVEVRRAAAREIHCAAAASRPVADFPAVLPSTLSPLTSTALQAAMSQADIEAWVTGQPPTSANLPSPAECPDLRVVKLFSLNDYLGLSTHPAVRQAAADAALQCGNGELLVELHATCIALPVFAARCLAGAGRGAVPLLRPP